MCFCVNKSTSILQYTDVVSTRSANSDVTNSESVHGSSVRSSVSRVRGNPCRNRYFCFAGGVHSGLCQNLTLLTLATFLWPVGLHARWRLCTPSSKGVCQPAWNLVTNRECCTTIPCTVISPIEDKSEIFKIRFSFHIFKTKLCTFMVCPQATLKVLQFPMIVHLVSQFIYSHKIVRMAWNRIRAHKCHNALIALGIIIFEF